MFSQWFVHYSRLPCSLLSEYLQEGGLEGNTRFAASCTLVTAVEYSSIARRVSGVDGISFLSTTASPSCP